ncbi:MAG: response regulator [Ruminiclostridium sp.]|nr:response regulator [Ruminiclostridium sp.]
MNRVVMTGKKETFAAKILMKKLNDAGIECIFVPLGVNSLHAKLEYTVLFVLLIEDGDEPEDDVLQFLSDKTVDHEKHMMVIGSANELEYVSQRVRADRIYRTFVRPVDNNVFVSTVRELFDKVSSGEFRKSLLVVDDDPAFLALVRDWLRDSYNVTGVSSGMQAIKWLGRNKADLVLLDYEMPVTTGPQVFEMLRSDEDTKDIPIIFLTGKSDRESVLAVLSLKPDGYFLKDIRKKELCDRLAEFFVLRGGK